VSEDWLAVVDRFHRESFDPARDAAKRAAQGRLLRRSVMTRLGTGPRATGAPVGWRMLRDLFLRCVRCGYFMSADPKTDDTCLCGALHKDSGAARVGSALGDEAIEVFRRTASRSRSTPPDSEVQR
jgi:hypothetical protein